MSVESRSLGGQFVRRSGDTMTGNLNMGANGLLTTDLRLGQESAATLQVRDAANTVYRDLRMRNALVNDAIAFQDNVTVDARDVDASIVRFRGRDSGVGLVDIARMVGAADPYLELTLPPVLVPGSVPGTPLEGHFWYDATLDKIMYRDAQGSKVVQAPLQAFKATTETIQSSIVLQNDDELLVAVEASRIYRVILFAIWNSGATPDFKYAFTIPTGATMDGLEVIGGASPANQTDLTASRSLAIGDGTNQGLLILAKLITGVNAGNTQFQWAQITSDASNTSVLRGSWMLVERIASI